VDWDRRVVDVEPADMPGVARWIGSGQPLGAVVARGVREILVGHDPVGVQLSERAQEKLTELRTGHQWAVSDATTLVVDDRGRARWWTFAGWKANLWLARMVDEIRTEASAVDDLRVAVDAKTSLDDLKRLLAGTAPDEIDLAPWVTDEAIDGLKFSECLPLSMAKDVVARRLADPVSVAQAVAERLTAWHNVD
jgi:ATP-dependent Lhr-like helicase